MARGTHAPAPTAERKGRPHPAQVWEKLQADRDRAVREAANAQRALDLVDREIHRVQEELAKLLGTRETFKTFSLGEGKILVLTRVQGERYPRVSIERPQQV